MIIDKGNPGLIEFDDIDGEMSVTMRGPTNLSCSHYENIAHTISLDIDRKDAVSIINYLCRKLLNGG